MNQLTIKHSIIISYKTVYWLALFISLLFLQACSSKIYRHHPADTSKTSVIETAQTLLGTPYRYGGNSPKSGFDCSGFIQYTFKKEGISVPRTSREQYKSTFPISRRQLKPGDLVFFRAKYEHYVSHVGLYIGKGRFIHAASSGKQVSINRLDQEYWRRYYYSAGRIF